jgi:6-phosphofructokinase 1
VRSGGSSAYDVNFGYRAGAAAVLLLLEGKTGNTVVNVSGKQVLYIPTPEAIKRREVDLSEVALFESLGTCFGRKPDTFSCEFVKVEGTIERPL